MFDKPSAVLAPLVYTDFYNTSVMALISAI